MATTLSAPNPPDTLDTVIRSHDWFKLPRGLTTPRCANVFTQPQALQPWTLTPHLVFES